MDGNCGGNDYQRSGRCKPWNSPLVNITFIHDETVKGLYEGESCCRPSIEVRDGRKATGRESSAIDDIIDIAPVDTCRCKSRGEAFATALETGGGAVGNVGADSMSERDMGVSRRGSSATAMDE